MARPTSTRKTSSKTAALPVKRPTSKSPLIAPTEQPAGAAASSTYFTMGRDRLGPIFNGYLARLHAVIGQPSARNGTAVLFAYRAGARLLDLYQAWLAARGIQIPSNLHGFKVSRLAACKAAYANDPVMALTAIGQELHGHGLHDTVRSLLAASAPASTYREDFEGEPLHKFMERDHPTALMLRDHLQEQSALYKSYMAELARGAKRIVLVDSGWRGTTQVVLERSYRDYDFQGLYFGTMGRTQILGSGPKSIQGLVFESERFDPAKPETCFALHRHLIESILEPDFESIQMITARDVAFARTPATIGPAGPGWDQAYAGVLHFVNESAGQGFAQQEAIYCEAFRSLAQSLSYPSRDEVDTLAGKRRSHDLGRAGSVEPVLAPKPRDESDNATHRMNDALWPAGQAALEASSPEEARSWQAGILAALSVPPSAKQYFHTHAESTQSTECGHVAVITRTKSRPLLLRRASDSVASQRYKDYTWVIVNDGGDVDEVMEVVKASLVNPAQIMICHNPQSLGMEAASNAGISGSKSDLIVIHDDDDAWHSDFLATTTRFLAKRGGIYSAVITHATYVSEEIQGDTVVEHSRRPYQDWARNVHLIELCAQNFFAPISFLFRRDIYSKIGGFDERLPVLGDWDFNLRYLVEGDIAVIPEPLSYYHHRDVGAAGGNYSNSVVAGVDRHAEYSAVLRNKYVRMATQNASMAVLANAMHAGYMQADLRTRMAHIPAQVAQGIEGERPFSLEHHAFQVLDERWVMLNFFAERIVRAEKLGLTAAQLIREAHSKFRQLAEQITFVPPSDFDEDGYLATYPDVADAMRQGLIPNAFMHYVRHGRQERRTRAMRAAQ